jgi:L-ascorbate metabolism protein UlaG (beta-lactamase superfamily)
MIFLVLAAVLLLAGFIFFRHPQFGASPRGERLQRMRSSVNYKKGQFQNQSFTPPLTKGSSYGRVIFDFLFHKNARSKPGHRIPSIKTDLNKLSPEEDILIWFGHSSYYLQVKGKRFLVDPVFGGNASPIPGSNRAFDGSDIYQPSDFPEIDYLLITHDHYDHLDHRILKQFKPRIRQVICGLGVGAHLEHWGYDSAIIQEMDWHEQYPLPNGMMLHTTPARHFSGRAFKRNNTLWLSFVLQAPGLNLYLGGDSGYDKHFKEIGEKFGPFDLALLDNGQHNPAWRAIHMFPEEVLQAATNLRAKSILPGHSGKFAMAMHAWDEPLREITELNKQVGHHLITPRIGEPVLLHQLNQVYERWWETV